MFDRFRESWVAPLGPILLYGIAQRLLSRYLYRPITVQATTDSSQDESTIWLPADLDHPHPAQLHQAGEPGLNNMPYKALAPRTAPRPAYESTRPKLTRPPKIACDACRSRKTAVSVFIGHFRIPKVYSSRPYSLVISAITSDPLVPYVVESF